MSKCWTSPVQKSAAFVASAQKRGARHYKRKAQNRVLKMEKFAPMSCQRQLKAPTTGRSTVYSVSSSNSQKQ
jgi:hypothetical protein